MTSAERLLRDAGLLVQGPVRWDEPVPCQTPGVYVIEAPRASLASPLDRAAIGAWIKRVPSLQVDGEKPKVAELAVRLASFWIPGETVVYVGLAGTSIARRVGQYYRTPLGDPRPHAGGHWLKTLAGLGEYRAWWATAADPRGAEDRLLIAFGRRHDGALPFANRIGPGGRKAHGITGSTVSRVATDSSASASASRRAPRASPRGLTAGRLARINAALQEHARAQSWRTITAVEGGRHLDRLGLLSDSASRPGLPLRELLRAGLIQGASQDGSRRWHIRAPRTP